MSEFPRRISIDKFTPAERAIWDATQAVEAMPADVRLTDAVVLLGKARERVADFVDGVEATAAEPATVGLKMRADLASIIDVAIGAYNSGDVEFQEKLLEAADGILAHGIALDREAMAKAYFDETRENLTIERCEWDDVAEYVKAQMRERVDAILAAGRGRA